ncbi:hypothetical protein F4212_14025 [Candidatus Poribacteria bacterium]|nr:hypothetical protein [Gammaproteobacteria bacterium]MYG00231.1 hypothetical protein [Candidatus Poribacteria bacterium]
MDFFNFYGRSWLEYIGDPFIAEAHLEVPGTGVKPTNRATATWSGKAIAINSSRDLFLRGDLIGGDATVTVCIVANQQRARLSLTNMKSAHFTRVVNGQHGPLAYDDFIHDGQIWINSQGVFSTDLLGGCAGCLVPGKLSGTGAAKVGGVFDIKGPECGLMGTYKGGYVADEDRSLGTAHKCSHPKRRWRGKVPATRSLSARLRCPRCSGSH